MSPRRRYCRQRVTALSPDGTVTNGGVGTVTDRGSRGACGDSGVLMFVQVIRGQVTDAERVRGALDQWYRELASGATGWLGSTGGVTDDGTFIALVRFESEAAARRNSDRPEQDQWWRQTATLFSGEVTFRDSDEVMVDVTGDPERAGFVQVMQGRASDPTRARELMTQDAEKWAAYRPDVLGMVTVQHGDGDYTAAVYFTSEAEAREGERKEPPPELRAQMEELNALEVGTPEYLDIREPWHYTPA